MNGCTSNGCNVCIFEWIFRRRGLCETTSKYEVDGQEDKFYRLKKALYGLNQAPRLSYNRIDEYLNGEGFSRSPSEPTLYTKVNQEGKILIVCLYVDDLIFTGDLSIDEFKKAMKTKFDMTD